MEWIWTKIFLCILDQALFSFYHLEGSICIWINEIDVCHTHRKSWSLFVFLFSLKRGESNSIVNNTKYKIELFLYIYPSPCELWRYINMTYSSDTSILPWKKKERKKTQKTTPENISKEYFDMTEFQNISRVIMYIISVVTLFSFSAHRFRVKCQKQLEKNRSVLKANIYGLFAFNLIYIFQ